MFLIRQQLRDRPRSKAGEWMMKTKIRANLRKFHEDETGIEAIQVVMILAIAAVALIVIKSQWENIKSWFNDNTDDATSGW